ncbi:uncharacterized protein A4U43_C01F360 [Asparagus officinalis]|uniref:Uncharacterized protein n=2 Tax=Asparagus officinalis TaxID=4686 RepID=A0A5P1FL96_ASPOF|nr:uncharacterized protein A4U43_C01F360 [Asparagus officinalis]
MNDEDEESLKKGNHIGEDLKAGKNSKKEMKEWDGKKDDGRGIKTVNDRKGKHIYGSDNYDSDNSGRHEGRGKSHGGVPTRHDFQGDFDTSGKQITRKTSNKQVRGHRCQGTGSSDSDSYSRKQDARKNAQSYIKKRGRYNTDSDSDLDRKRFGKQRTNTKKSDSDDSESDGNYRKRNRKEKVIEHKKHGRMHKAFTSDSDSDSDYAMHNKGQERNSRGHGSDGKQAEGDDTKGNVTKGTGKISKPGIMRHDTGGRWEMNENEKKNIKKDVAYVKAKEEVIEKKRNQHDTDDESSDSEGARERTLKAKKLDGKKLQGTKRKHHAVTDDNDSSESDYGSDSDSDDSRNYKQTRHGSGKACVGLGDRENEKLTKKHRSTQGNGSSYWTGGRYDRGNDRMSNQNIDDGVSKSIRKREVNRMSNQNIDDGVSKSIRKREVEEKFPDMLDSKSGSAGIKEERKKEGDSKGHAKYNRSSEDRIMEDRLYSNNRERQTLKEHSTDSKRDSKSRREYGQGHDDAKRKRHKTSGQHHERGSYEHKYREDLAPHRRWD